MRRTSRSHLRTASCWARCGICFLRAKYVRPAGHRFAAAALPALCCPPPGGKAMGKKRKRRDDKAEGDDERATSGGMKKKAYEKALKALSVELVTLQEGVKPSG